MGIVCLLVPVCVCLFMYLCVCVSAFVCMPQSLKQPSSTQPPRSVTSPAANGKMQISRDAKIEIYTILFPLDKWSWCLINNIWCVKYLFTQQKGKREGTWRQAHICREYIIYIQYMVIDSTPINAATFKIEKGLNMVLRPQCCFDAQATFLSISVCVCFVSVLIFCSFTHIVDTHTHTNAKIYPCWGQILISLSDSLLALHPNGLVLHRVYIWWQILHLIYPAFLQCAPTSFI